MSTKQPDAHTGPIQQCKAALFPPEILSQIFHIIVIPEHDEHGRTIYQTTDTPWSQLIRLCLVCRSWRFGALASRASWAQVYKQLLRVMRTERMPGEEVPPLASLEKLEFVGVEFDGDDMERVIQQIVEFVEYRDAHEMLELGEVSFVGCGNVTEDTALVLKETMEDDGLDVEVRFEACT